MFFKYVSLYNQNKFHILIFTDDLGKRIKCYSNVCPFENKIRAKSDKKGFELDIKNDDILLTTGIN